MTDTINWSCLDQLYDRQSQIDLLRRRYHRIIAGDADQSELVLVSGPSGSGKTVLALTLVQEVGKQGFFVRGKFDQLQKPDSFAPFVSSFVEFAMQAQEKGIVEELRDEIDMEGEGKLMTQMIPALEEIMGSQPGLPSKQKGFEAKKQLHRVFRRFIRCISSPSRPFVLFIDDLQWANRECLDLLSALLTDDTLEGFMILGACRGNEVSVDDDLSVVLRYLEDNCHVSITNIGVRDLRQEAVVQIVGDLTSLPEDMRLSLARLVFQQTKGNPFYTVQYLKSMFEDGTLQVEGDLVKLDVDQANLSVSADVVQFMRRRISRLPPEAQEMLQVAACIGAEFDIKVLQLASSDCWQVTEQAGLVQKVRGSAETRYAFVHDKVQQACYSLIPQEKKAEFHLAVGRQLWNSLEVQDLLTNARIVVNVLRPGMHLIVDESERENAAQLCLQAGNQVREVSSFRAAATYFEIGLTLLGRRSWRDRYYLTLDLCLAAAEVEYAIGNCEKTEELLSDIFANARSFHDKLPAYITRVYALGTQQKMQESIDCGLYILKELKQPLPRNAGARHTILEVIKTKRMLRGFSDQDILNLDPVEEGPVLDAMRVLNVLIAYVFQARPHYAPLVAMRTIQLTLRHGLSELSCFGFAFYSLMLGTLFGVTEEGLRCSRMTMLIQRKYERKEWVARVYMLYYAGLHSVVNPLRDSLEPLMYGHKTGLATGDSEFGMLCAHLYCSCALFSCQPLDQLYDELIKLREIMASYKQHATLALHEPQVQYVANLMGESDDPLSLTGRYLQEHKALHTAGGANNQTVLLCIYMMKIAICYIMNEYARADAWCVTMHKRCKLDSVVLFARWWGTIFDGLTALALLRESKLHLRRRKRAKNAYRYFKKFASTCSHNVKSRIYFIEAEMLVLRGRLPEALDKYNLSIECASQEKLLLEQALACERAAISLLEGNRTEEALSYYGDARDVFEKYGARVKVQQMERTIAEMEATTRRTQ